ncbi:hypothetical protein THAOC_07907, partial [Thalassiosira oceanica]
MPPSGTDGFRSGGLSRNPSLFPWLEKEIVEKSDHGRPSLRHRHPPRDAVAGPGGQ